MPTAARLIAAIALALAAYGVSGVVEFRHETLRVYGVSGALFATIGGLIGWSRVGPAADRGYRNAWAAGLGAVVTCYVAIVLLAALNHVYNGLEIHAYKDVDALFDGFIRKSTEYALYMFDGPVLLAALFGGLLAGVFAGFAGRIWT